MITYDWNCKTVDVHPTEEGLTDVVYNVHWTVTGTKEEYKASNMGTQIIKLNSGSDFIPFEDLTNEIVTQWTKEAIGEENISIIESNIAYEISELENPTSITMTIEG